MMFFNTGIFKRGKGYALLITAIALYFAALSVLGVAVTAACTDANVSAIRTLYKDGEQWMDVSVTVTTCDSTHWYSTSVGRTEFTKRQKDLLIDYAGSDIIFNEDESKAHVKLSGDLSKDKRLMKDLKGRRELGSGEGSDPCGVRVYGASTIGDGERAVILFGSTLQLHEFVLLMICGGGMLVAAVVLACIHCKRLSADGEKPSLKILLLQGAVLAASIVALSLAVSYLGLLIVNAAKGATGALVPSLVPSLIIAGVGTATVFPVPVIASLGRKK